MNAYGIKRRVGDAGNTEYTLDEIITIHLPLENRGLFDDDSDDF